MNRQRICFYHLKFFDLAFRFLAVIILCTFLLFIVWGILMK